MVTLRATRKVLRLLPPPRAASGASDTALGDWYVNRIVVDRRPLLLIVSERSRLSIIEPARDVRELPARLPDLVRRRLAVLGIPESRIATELRSMDPIGIGPTVDRSIVGQMVEFAKVIPVYLPVDGWGEPELRIAEDRLGKMPCLSSGRVGTSIWPAEEAAKRLAGHGA